MNEAAASAPASAPVSAPTTANAGSDTTEIQGSAPQLPKTVKVNGKEVPLPPMEVLQRDYAKFLASEEKFQEAAVMKKQAIGLIERLKSDPLGVLKDPRLGHNMRKLAEDYLLSELENEMLPAEEKERRELKKRLSEYESREAEIKKQEAERQLAERSQQYAQEYEKSIMAVLQSNRLPPTRDTVARMAAYMQEGLKKGIRLTAEDVAPLVIQDLKSSHMSIFGSMDEDSIIEALGEDLVKKVRRADLKRVKLATKSLPKDKAPAKAKSAPASSKSSVKEWMRQKQMERMKAGRR